MRVFKSHPLLSPVNSYLIDSPQPSNLSYLWNFGSLLGFCLIIQIITGVTLAMHYNPSTLEAFNSVEHIMRDVNNGWLIRYLHSNTASAFFFLVYLHIGRGMYYCSYKAPRTLTWTIGTVILIVMMATAFLGYVLPYGQMSLWGATVITNLMSAIPWIGQDIVEFIWGGFSVNNATLNRFFALHFVLPFVIAALALMHLISFHEGAGSGNPLGVSANYDRLPFAPYYIFKDLITIFLFIIIISLFVFFMPNVLGDSENYVMANPMQTPPAIVPEWYLLPFYAILRSIPNKLLGVIAMFSAILTLLTLPFADFGRSRGLQFRPLSKLAFYIFVANFLILMQLGAKHVESPYIEFGQISTVLYFAHFIIIMPVISLIENTLIDINSLSLKNKNIDSNSKKDVNHNSINYALYNTLRINQTIASRKFFSTTAHFKNDDSSDDGVPSENDIPDLLPESIYIESQSKKLIKDITPEDVRVIAEKINAAKPEEAQSLYEECHKQINTLYAVSTENNKNYKKEELDALKNTELPGVDHEKERETINTKYNKIEQENFNYQSNLKGELRFSVQEKGLQLLGLDENDQDSVQNYLEEIKLAKKVEAIDETNYNASCNDNASLYTHASVKDPSNTKNETIVASSSKIPESGTKRPAESSDGPEGSNEEQSSKKRFKQDSSDIGSENEPYDPFCDE